MNKLLFVSFVATGGALIAGKAGADTPTLPGEGFSASHYEVLWTKSPFSVSSSETVSESPDYALVGVARFDGIYYASLIDQKSQEHFLVTSAMPARGLTLISVTSGRDAADTFAVVQKGGQSMTLKMQVVSAASTVPPNANPGQAAAPPTPQGGRTAMSPMPGAWNGPGANDQPPPVQIHRSPTRFPPRPD